MHNSDAYYNPCEENILSTLSRALDGRQPARRVFATCDSPSTEEGLALLSAYVGIPDQKTRQAILDAVIAISSCD